MIEIWEEGEAFRKIHSRLQEIQVDKEDIERLKKNRNKSKVQKKGNLPLVPTDGFSGNSRGGSNGIQNSMLSFNENSEFDFEESEFNNIDKNE